ncbi:MAG: HIT family protein [Cytophagales bacterium]|jgi:histidine triad (HIT) family protein|nr:HIT family protein [Bacteroidota bacterium]MBS1981927.1 HIT family protein [Bacteroidota bacterium]WHZ09375.1 MAG: HIT family protein [Cytophagales bacterium]
MPSIFTKIINREIPSYTVAEDENFIAFLDINPLAVGHTLVIPKIEIDYFFDLDESTLSSLMVFAKKISSAIQAVTNCKRVGVAVIGFEVPHAHMHLVPMNSMHDINFANPKLKLSKEEFADTAKRIKEKFLLN